MIICLCNYQISGQIQFVFDTNILTILFNFIINKLHYYNYIKTVYISIQLRNIMTSMAMTILKKLIQI